MDSSRNKFLDGLNELVKIVFEAHSSYEIWWICINRDDRQKYIKDVFLKYEHFFETISHANFVTIIIALYKLFETNNNTVNLNDIIERAINLIIIDQDDKTNLGPLITKSKLIWEKVAKLRSNLFAHRSKKWSRNEIYKMAEITPNQIKELTEYSLEIMNYLLRKATIYTLSFEDFCTSDMYKLLETLKSKNIFRH